MDISTSPDRDRRKNGEERAARPDVIGAEPIAGRSERGVLARLKVHHCDREPGRAVRDPFPIDDAIERRPIGPVSNTLAMPSASDAQGSPKKGRGVNTFSLPVISAAQTAAVRR